ncbi:MAG TPA: PIN domain-containing protein [Anaerolineae bacterium]|nr:PIN domain-containing protein [Anaerolineae bacterium]HIP72067.1 PIN domain-containing protein [Anaerolineae bacterium]
MIVADTNLIAYLFIAGDKTETVHQVYQQDKDWFVPPLWRHEFLNVLAKYIRYEGASITDALSIWQSSVQFLSYRERRVNLTDALQLAASLQMSTYDAQFLTLAQSLGCWLVTEDKQLLKKSPEYAQSMQQFLDSQQYNSANGGS